MAVAESPRTVLAAGGTTPERNLLMLFDSTLPLSFWRKVYADPSGCWLWQGYLTAAGYGRYGKHAYAHRVSYEASRGRIPPGLTTDHLCRARNCVRPDHMEVVTHRVNVLRGTSFSARNARLTHCMRGHEYSALNTHVRPDGARMCRPCVRLRRALKRKDAARAVS